MILGNSHTFIKQVVERKKTFSEPNPCRTEIMTTKIITWNDFLRFTTGWVWRRRILFKDNLNNYFCWKKNRNSRQLYKMRRIFLQGNKFRPTCINFNDPIIKPNFHQDKHVNLAFSVENGKIWLTSFQINHI